VVYDGAHAFGTTYEGRSVLRYGDITAMSFHATKPFHMVEGGALITESDHLAEQIDLLRAFGHEGADHQRNGINAKNSEFHAAMGLCMLPRMEAFLERRREMCRLYRSRLDAPDLSFQHVPDVCRWNCAYAPVLFPSYDAMMHVKASLEEQDIYPRRYFSPSLNNLPYLEAGDCPVAETVARRILCLPFFQEMEDAEIERVADAVNRAMAEV
jgi:dTDP-4-amino-4,6-dideoxygalactose transaminase